MDMTHIRALNEKVEKEALFLKDVLAEIRKVIVGQDALVERILIALLADGHVLLEGVPGLAKTLLVKTVAQAIDAQFARIQFTPDLLPADLIGTQIYNPLSSDSAQSSEETACCSRPPRRLRSHLARRLAIPSKTRPRIVGTVRKRIFRSSRNDIC